MTSYQKAMAEAKAEFEALMLGEWERKNRKAQDEEEGIKFDIHEGCGGRIIGVDPDGMGNLYHCSKCGSDEV